MHYGGHQYAKLTSCKQLIDTSSMFLTKKVQVCNFLILHIISSEGQTMDGNDGTLIEVLTTREAKGRWH